MCVLRTFPLPSGPQSPHLPVLPWSWLTALKQRRMALSWCWNEGPVVAWHHTGAPVGLAVSGPDGP